MKITTITFEDQGQDFLEWDLDEKGKVVGCRPGQAWIWVGAKVSLESLAMNECPYFKSKLEIAGILKYKVIKIEKKEETHVETNL